MSEDVEFTKNSIKNDLRRVSKWAVDPGESLPAARIRTFLSHAQKEFRGLGRQYEDLSVELEKLSVELDKISDPLGRVRWAERVLTLSCRV